MSRLADYFVIVGYDKERDRNGNTGGCGKVIQRFPEKDWSDTPFIEGIEWFCQPLGWCLSSERVEPRFFVSVLTDIDANRHYCACLCFSEAVTVTPSKPVDEEEDIDGSDAPTSFSHLGVMYAPKCLVLVSRLQHFETFRNCLGTIYTVHTESMGIPIETLVGNVLGCVYVPPPGGPQVRFSIGAGDRQALQPPLSPSVPVSGSSVAALFVQLGIRNSLVLFCAVMTEQKVLFHSLSYSRLMEACHALTNLLFPFRYNHVYIPLLPSALGEVLSTPTPFLIGVHSSLRHDTSELLDVIVVDLDGGSVHIPDGLMVPLLPEPLWSSTHSCLSLILHPELSIADHAFTSAIPFAPSPPQTLDKEIRAVFLRLTARLIHGYRCCLTIIRIHPRPVITFHKALFLSQRGLADSDFARRLLECMFYTSFVAERGPPWRPCDLWDEVYGSLPELLRAEKVDKKLLHTHLTDLSHQLELNENPNPQPYVQKLLRPPDGFTTRVHQPPFPSLDPKLVQAVIGEGAAKSEMKHSDEDGLNSIKPSQPRIVPLGPALSSLNETGQLLVTNSARRLEVLRSCVNCIFENRISDARKTFPAVLRALKAKSARLALCSELAHHVRGNKAVLEHQQFDLVVRLMNCALQDDTDEHSVASALLPLSTAFCRKLCTGVIQFAYTCIQEHAVWQQQQFWEAAFYQDVQRDIKALYNPIKTTDSSSNLNGSHSFHEAMHPGLSPSTPRELKDIWRDRRSGVVRTIEPSALEIAAEQLRQWTYMDAEKKKEVEISEESTVYSQAIHYANRMVYLLVPLDIGVRGRGGKDRLWTDDDRTSTSITNSVAESDSVDAESGFEECAMEGSESGAGITRVVSRFVDKVCTEGGVSQEHIRALHQMIPGVVAMHIETLEGVHRESKRLPPIQKPKILSPSLLPGEEVVLEGPRVYLLADGRDEWAGGGGQILLPAEGALFISNYRLIFKGNPCDPFACEQTVLRCFPLASLTKEKRISVQYVAHLDQLLQEGIQLRSASFQLLKLAFDEDVTSESVDVLRKVLHRLRHPQHPLDFCAFTGQQPYRSNHSGGATLTKDKEKSATLKGFAKKTLLRTAKKAGFKGKTSSKRQKYILPPQGGHMTHGNTQRHLPGGDSPDQDDDLSVCDDGDHPNSIPNSGPSIQTDAKTIERLQERSYCKDWQRLGLVSPKISTLPHHSKSITAEVKKTFRISPVNAAYTMCRSYPALLVVPSQVSDDSIRRFSRCYRQCRFPVITWRHPTTHALLLRGSSFHGKGVMAVLKGHQPTSGASHDNSTSSLEQEKYLCAIVNATPSLQRPLTQHNHFDDSTFSIDSLMVNAEHLPTPDTLRRGHHGLGLGLTGPFAKAIGTLRTSGGKSNRSFGRWGSLKERKQGSQTSLLTPPSHHLSSTNRLSFDSETGLEFRASVYLFGEKTQVKGVSKSEGMGKVDFIPVEMVEVRQTKAAFKKLLRACLPSSPLAEPEHSFHRAVEASDWLQQLQSIMQLSGAMVDLLDIQGSSVMVCLEDGWDFTSQVCSVVQLCLDPYYRTIDGFRVLVEKDWLAFGHRFAHRCALPQDTTFAPVFLQFLDIVHQIQHQFPLSFEFNNFYLKFLAYHSVSGRFRTFLMDSELERQDLGVMAADDKRGSLSRAHKGVVEIASDDDDGRIHVGQSIFEYIDKLASRQPLFHNFFYCPDAEFPILRPYWHLSNMEIWDFYLEESLSSGPAYDLEVVAMDNQRQEEVDVTMGRTGTGHHPSTLTKGYDNQESSSWNAYFHLLGQIRHLETELGHLPQKWHQLWDKLEAPSTDSLMRQASLTTQMIRSHGCSIHKRSTLEILVRCKASESAVQVYSHPHRFERYNFTTPIYCDLCSHVLWGLVKTGMRCVDCGYNCHEKCVEGVQKSCTKYKSQGDGAQTTTQGQKAPDSNSISSSVGTLHTNSQRYYEQFSSHVAENRTLEGYLFKRGALLKGWKQRWFVLDSIKHQLRYYDSMEDSHCKGYIDLAEVDAVATALVPITMGKKSDNKVYFDLRTIRRTYNFCADDVTMAQEWVEKIQSCLQ